MDCSKLLDTLLKQNRCSPGKPCTLVPRFCRPGSPPSCARFCTQRFRNALNLCPDMKLQCKLTEGDSRCLQPCLTTSVQGGQDYKIYKGLGNRYTILLGAVTFLNLLQIPDIENYIRH